MAEDTEEKREYRLRPLDPMNWVIERYKPPKLKKDGTMSAGKWITDGYYPNLQSAAENLLTKVQLAGNTDTITIEGLIEATREAKEAVIAAVQEALEHTYETPAH